MVNIAFCVLCHEDVSTLAPMIEVLSSRANYSVVIHYDRNCTTANFRELCDRFGSRNNVFFTSREKVSWGKFSIVKATINCLTTIEQHFEPDYVYLLSGSDFPIRSLDDLDTFLGNNSEFDFIESISALQQWITDGDQDERFKYFHYFSWRSQQQLYYRSIRFQKWLKIKRRPPKGIKIYLGSQWWCMRWKTCLKILSLIRTRPKVMRFFRLTWIADESFFQSLVRCVESKPYPGPKLTLTQFDQTGRQITFYNDHYDYLLRQNGTHFFARKISPRASKLRSQLTEIALANVETPSPQIIDRGSEEKINEFDAFSKWGRWGIRTTRRAFYSGEQDRGFDRLQVDITLVTGLHNVIVELGLKKFTQNCDCLTGGLLLEGNEIDYREIPGNVYMPEYTPEMRDYMPLEFLSTVSKISMGKPVTFGLILKRESKFLTALIDSPRCSIIYARPEFTSAASKWYGLVTAVTDCTSSDHGMQEALISNFKGEHDDAQRWLHLKLLSVGKTLRNLDVCLID